MDGGIWWFGSSVNVADHFWSDDLFSLSQIGSPDHADVVSRCLLVDCFCVDHCCRGLPVYPTGVDRSVEVVPAHGFSNRIS